MNCTRSLPLSALRAATLAMTLSVSAALPAADGAPIPVQPTPWVPTGPAAQAHFGYSVATAGDVNGDGLSDVIVGAPFYGHGRAWVYYGGVDMDTQHDWTVGGPAASSYGWSVAPAGDVNGDGYDDVLVGAPGGVGYAFCYHGSAAGLEGVPAWYTTNSSGSKYGLSVATAGDINGDGYSDVLVGAPDWGGIFGDLGRVYLYLGSPTGLSTSAWSFTGTNPADVGRSVATAGDVNADGYDDFLIGDPGYDAGAVSQNNGRVLLFHGHSSGTPTQSSSLVGPAAGAQYGAVVAPAGDFNRDGYADALMGSPAHNFSAGRVVLLRGNAVGFSQGGTFDGTAVAGYGHSVGPAGDLNGDGYADFVVSALFEGPNEEGRVYVHAGNPSGLFGSPAWTLHGTQAGGNLGRSVATAGDVDGDGFADLIIGEDFYDVGANQNAGRAHLFRGGTAGMSAASYWFHRGDQIGETYGKSLATADVNADGFDDLLVGSPDFDGSGGSGSGRVELIYGSAAGLDAYGMATWVPEGDVAGDAFGWSVACAGDINRDGYDDLLVGIPGDDTRGSDAGQARLYYGGASGPSNVPAWTSDVGAAGDSLGSTVAFAGDINGDGYLDVLIGSSAYGTGGAVFCYLGTAGGLSTAPATTLEGSQPGSRFGFSIGSADRDGDGYTDVFVGVPGWDGAALDEGRVLGYRGGPEGLETTPTWDWVGSAISASPAGIQLGHAVCGISAPGGGEDGVAFSAPWFSGGVTPNQGIVWFDFDGGPDSTIGVQNGEMRGFSIADAGDCNGDGRGDVVVGATGFSAYTVRDGAWGVHSVIDSQEWWNYHLSKPDGLGGYAVTSGDFDGDGLADAVGSVLNAVGGPDGGDGLVGLRRAGSSDYWTAHAADLRNGSGERLSRLGVTDEETAVHVSLDRAQSAAGRTRVRQEWWVFPTADGPEPGQLTISGTGSWTDTGPRVFGVGSATPLLDEVNGLNPSTLYSIQWRTRTRNPFFPYSRWFRVGDAGRNSGHFRTAGTLVSVGDPIPWPEGTLLASPNPFRTGTLLRFSIPSRGDLEARVFDVNGRLVRTLDRGQAEAGPQELFWDGRSDGGVAATPGVYFLRVTSGSYQTGGRIVLMR